MNHFLTKCSWSNIKNVQPKFNLSGHLRPGIFKALFSPPSTSSSNVLNLLIGGLCYRRERKLLGTQPPHWWYHKVFQHFTWFNLVWDGWILCDITVRGLSTRAVFFNIFHLWEGWIHLLRRLNTFKPLNSAVVIYNTGNNDLIALLLVLKFPTVLSFAST